MTIPAGESSLNVYTGNGVADTFDYEFKVSAESDLLVVQTDTNDVETTLALTTDYTVTGVGDDDGGTITLVAGALTSGYRLTISDNIELSQLTPFGNQSTFLASNHENAFDKLTRLVRRLFTDNSLNLSIGAAFSESVSLELPAPDSEKLLRWNSGETALENVSPSTINGEAAIASWTHRLFVATTDFTPGTTTQLVLGADPGSKSNCQIYFDKTYVSKSDYSISGSTITFTAAIPLGTSEVEVVYGQSAGDAGPDHSGISPLASDGLQVSGGDISADFTYSLDVDNLTAITGQNVAAGDKYLVWDDSAGAHKAMRHQDGGWPIIDDTGTSRVIAATDAQHWIRMNNASPITVTINDSILVKGNEIAIEQAGAGQVTVAVGGTAVINGRTGLKTAGQYAVVFIKVVDTDVLTLGGDAST